MTMLREALGADRFDPMAADPVAFVRVFDKEPWPYQQDHLREITELSPGGTFEKSIAIVSMPRQNGKSTESAWIGLWRLFCAPEHQEIISVALDKDSARIILNEARRIIESNDILLNLTSDFYGITKNTIKLKDGRSWQIKSSEAKMSRGLRPSTLCYDELGWSADDGALFTTLTAGQAAQVNPLTVITSTVSPIQAGPLWDLFEQAEEGDPDVRLIYETENLSPLITDEFLARQERTMPAIEFAREHRNKWSEGTEVFCTRENWDAAIADGDPRRDRDAGPCYLFCDLGWRKDETAIAVSKREAEKIDIVHLEGFKPRAGRELDLTKVEDRIVELVGYLNVKNIEIESPQGVLMSQRIRDRVKGVTVVAMHPTAKSNRERWGSFYSALKNEGVRLPKDKLLRRQLLTLTIKDSLTGWRVQDVKSIHNDRAVACAGAVYMVKTKKAEIKVMRLYDAPEKGEWGKKQPAIKQEMFGNPGRVG